MKRGGGVPVKVERKDAVKGVEEARKGTGIGEDMKNRDCGSNRQLN